MTLEQHQIHLDISIMRFLVITVLSVYYSSFKRIISRNPLYKDDNGFNGTVVDRALPSVDGGLLKIMHTAQLT